MMEKNIGSIGTSSLKDGRGGGEKGKNESVRCKCQRSFNEGPKGGDREIIKEGEGGPRKKSSTIYVEKKWKTCN